MNNTIRNLVVAGGMIGSYLGMPITLPAASGCNVNQLLGVYNAQVSNVDFQNVLQSLKNPTPTDTTTTPPTTTTTTVTGFNSNPSSLSGSMPALGRYYFDGTGNIIGVTAATANSPAVNASVGTYKVNVDCSASITLASGATYDVFLANGGQQGLYVRTDTSGAGDVGVLRHSRSCVSLNYPGSYAFELGGGSKQTDSTGASTFAPYATAGVISLDGSGSFSMSETLYNSGGLARSTATGTYTVGGDCSLTFKFSTASGANSKNFVAPSSLRVLMVDATTGLLTLQPDANTTLAGTLIAQ